MLVALLPSRVLRWSDRRELIRCLERRGGIVLTPLFVSLWVKRVEVFDPAIVRLFERVFR